MGSSTKVMTRSALVTPLAIERVQYERYVASLGHTEAAHEPMIPFIKFQVRKMAERGQRIHGVKCWRTDYGWYFEANVDWAALAARVEKALPTWRAAAERLDGPVEVRS